MTSDIFLCSDEPNTIGRLGWLRVLFAAASLSHAGRQHGCAFFLGPPWSIPDHKIRAVGSTRITPNLIVEPHTQMI